MAADLGDQVRQRFPWRETEARLVAFMARWPETCADERGGWFAPSDSEDEPPARLVPPLVLPAPAPGEAAAVWLDRLPVALGVEVVVLLQAGAAALGLWCDDELVVHKALKKYVVRGSGKAQPTHLKTRGKSRYGSRLRLRNARALLVEVNERLGDWWRESGAFDRVHWSCPKRTWPELFATRPAPPFGRDDPALCRVPWDVHVPNHAELLRIRRLLTQGFVQSPS